MSLPDYDEAACRAGLNELAERFETRLSDGQVERLLKFTSLVCVWGQRTDLVAAKTVDALMGVLFLDAFAIAPAVPLGVRLIDVGAGAGAPAVPLAILRSDLHLTMLEPRRRRVAFMRTAIGTLNLASRTGLIESYLPAPAELPALGVFDMTMSRATFHPEEWLSRAAPISAHTLVLLAGGQPPQLEGWTVGWQLEYETHDGVPRRALRFDRSPGRPTT